jgi:hypothetical protein
MCHVHKIWGLWTIDFGMLDNVWVNDRRLGMDNQFTKYFLRTQTQGIEVCSE